MGNYNSGFNNCDLSDLEPRDLDPVRHLVVDRDADIYERNLLGRNCRETPLTVWNNNQRPTINPPSRKIPFLALYSVAWHLKKNVGIVLFFLVSLKFAFHAPKPAFDLTAGTFDTL